MNENEEKGIIQFVGFTREEAVQFIRRIVLDCLAEMKHLGNGKEEALDIDQVCKLLGVSPPTLKKFVDCGLIRRHDLGSRKKVFYESEVREDIKFLQYSRKG